MSSKCVFAAALLIIIVLAGCSQRTVESAGQDAQRNIAVLNHQADKIAKDAKPQLDKLGLGARVTAALQANANLPHTIRVDAGAHGVRLHGSVHSVAQKQLAGRVASDTLGPDKTVSNELTIK